MVPETSLDRPMTYFAACVTLWKEEWLETLRETGQQRLQSSEEYSRR